MREPALLEIEINSAGPDGPFTATPRGTVEKDPQTIAIPDFREFLQKIDAGQTNLDLFKTFGIQLFNTLFQGQVRDAYQENLGRLGGQQEDVYRLRIVLKIQERARRLYELPWMLMFDPGATRQWWLGCANHATWLTPLSQGVIGDPHQRPFSGPVKILLVTASPLNRAAVDCVTHESAIRGALHDALSRGTASLETLHNATRTELEKTLEEVRPHILHLHCHGPAARGQAFGAPSISLQNENGSEDTFHIDILSSMLVAWQHSLRLVVLTACNSDGVAWELAKRGIPAIGMRYEIVSTAAHQFATALYSQLKAQQPLDNAVNFARNALRRRNEHHRDWFAPSLFMPSGDPVLFAGTTGHVAMPGFESPLPQPPELHQLQVIVKLNGTPLSPVRISLARDAGATQWQELGDTNEFGVLNVSLADGTYQLRAGWLGAPILVRSTPLQQTATISGSPTQMHFLFTPPDAPPPSALMTLRVTSWPASRADVFVNNVPSGRTPQTVPIHPGTNTVTLRKPGHLVVPRERRVQNKPATRFLVAPLSLPLGLVLVALVALIVGQHLWATWRPAGMVYVPAGNFKSGGDRSPLLDMVRPYTTIANLDSVFETEVKRLVGEGFDIDRYEVTNRQYRTFLDSPGSRQHARHDAREGQDKNHTPRAEEWTNSQFNQPNQPVVGVDWYDAVAFCAWAGKRLPSGNEWERAARGVEGRLFPWGDDFDAKRANTAISGINRPAPVGSYEQGRTAEGVYDLAGNVAEWTADSTVANGSETKVVRGGAWNQGGDLLFLSFLRSPLEPTSRGPIVGFRCAKSASSGPIPDDMVFIAPGEFIVGSDSSFTAALIRRTKISGTAVHQVIGEPPSEKHLDEFLIDTREVTNAEYRQFLDAGGQHRSCLAEEKNAYPAGKDHRPKAWAEASFSQPDQPVVSVDWYDAAAYCAWRGGRLPTSAEWERAARGTEGRRYPWGDQFDANRCNTSDAKAPAGKTVAVGSLPGCKTPDGVFDLVGNADEWTSTVGTDPSGGTGEVRVVKGGSWAELGEIRGLGYVEINASIGRHEKDMGFRCALTPPRSWLTRLGGLLWGASGTARPTAASK